MATYCLSDLHGHHDIFLSMLNYINFNNEDTLYILGDILDKGPEVYEIYKHIQENNNIIALKGNHELMAEMAIKYGANWDLWEYGNYGKDSINSFYKHLIDYQYEFETEKYADIKKQYGENSFKKYCAEQKILKYCEELPYLVTTNINNRDFILVHAGYLADEEFTNQTPEDFVWIRENFYLNATKHNALTIFGHTPTQNFGLNGEIWIDKKNKDKICIDGGVFLKDIGQLNCIRLDDLKCFSIKTSDLSKKEFNINI